MDKKKVMIWPAGTEVGREIVRALRDEKHIELIGAGNTYEGCAPDLLEKTTVLSEQFDVRELVSRCLSLKVNFIYPAHDEVCSVLDIQASNILEENGIRVLGPDAIARKICRSKSLTYTALCEKGRVISIPYVFNSPPPHELYPVFVKPDTSQGSRGAGKANDQEELVIRLREARQFSKRALILEYLPGKEITVDCFSDSKRNLRYTLVRERNEIKSGISVCSLISFDKELNDILHLFAKEIGSCMEMSGAWFFQVKMDAGGKPVVMEVGARPAGGSSLARARGVNLPLLTLYNELDVPIVIQETAPNVVSLRRHLTNEYSSGGYFNLDVFVDLDDTLCSERGMNERLVSALYSVKQRGGRIHLLTRSSIEAGMDRLRRTGLTLFPFTKTFFIGPEARKSDFIHREGKYEAVFVDDSFRERNEVFTALGISCYAPDAAAEVLMQERV